MFIIQRIVKVWLGGDTSSHSNYIVVLRANAILIHNTLFNGFFVNGSFIPVWVEFFDIFFILEKLDPITPYYLYLHNDISVSITVVL